MLILKIDTSLSISYFHYTLLPYVGILVENVLYPGTPPTR